MQIAQQVNVGKIHLLGPEHLIGLLRKKQLPELDMFNVAMQTYYQLTQGGLEAPLAIHNVGGNSSFPRSDTTIENAMLPRILTAIAIMVIVPLLRVNALYGCLPCIFYNIHSFGAQFWNPKLEAFVLTELPNSTASKVCVCLLMRICVSLLECQIPH